MTLLGAGAISALAAALVATAGAGKPTPATVAALPPAFTEGHGADVPFVEYEAENAHTNGERVGPDRTFATIAAEASGRRAVRLEGQGRFVEFTLAQSANALVLRSAIPDSPDGAGRDATLGIYVADERVGSLTVSSRYGWFYGAYPFTNRPSDGRPHHVFGESRLLLDRTLSPGTKVRLMVGAGDDAPWYVVDLADFELVPPPAAPPLDALSIVDFGADPTGLLDSAAAVRAAVAAGQESGRTVWIPPGTFRVDGHVIVDRVTLAGAGPWYSVLRGDGVGVYGKEAPDGSQRVILRDFSIIGEVRERKDHLQLAGIGGAMGGGSRISNLWIQHVKVGLWFDGPMDGITVSGLRILDVAADGLNFHRGVSNAVVENSFIRNSGDDGLAAWSGGQADHDIVFRRNTVIAPTLANGIAIYGGRDILVEGNLVADSLTQGGGIHVGNRFKAVPAAGRIRIADNMIVRSGSFDPNWRFGVGALWFYALDAPIAAAIEVRNLDILDSSEEAIQFIGKSITGVSLEDVTIERTGAAAIQLRSPGSASLSRVRATGLGGASLLDCRHGFALRDGGGNVGMDGIVDYDCAPRD